ncbi:hypothetical protein [Albirhodobacter sp. R86504]|uniref:hypothetical protein n=1 Tax=Albirhodobacter sp. R86504 TaxID=3093848 RepID=UPI003671C52A
MSMTRLWETQKPLVIVFSVACALALFFAGQMIARALYWADPAHVEILPEPWMTPGYIGRSWGVSRAQMVEILDLPELSKPPKTLEEIADERGIPVEDLLDDLMRALPQKAAAQ